VPLEQIIDFLSADWQLFTVIIFEEIVIVFQCIEATVVGINAPERVPDIDLAEFVLPMHLQLVLKLKEVFEQFAHFHVG